MSEVIKITTGNHTAWMSKEMYEEFKKKEYSLWWGPRIPYVPKEESFVKLALVDGNKMIGVYNQTMQGYELDDRYPAVKLPLVPTTYTTFNRWATSFDV
jgi:hypothetical protein